MVPSNHRSNTSVSVVVLAFNEAQNLPNALDSIKRVLEGRFSEYEVIIVNDGSRDNTGEVAEGLARQDSHLKVVHNPHNMGCGFTFMRGVRAAGCQYVWLIPGDGEIPDDSIAAIADRIGTSDMVIPYVTNFSIRPLSRRIVSWGYTALLNILFWKRLHYYNGPCAFRTDLAKSVPTVNSRGFAFMAPILLRLMKRGHSYVEVGILLQNRRYGRPTISSLWNIFSALRTIARLFWDINLGKYFRKTQETISVTRKETREC
ncbi:MAG: glycosyltransferase family 2 protein [Chloroflexota bacterium]|nr:glycosyltransferase family 2 protein [Chloroflexota bacterium]